MTTDDDPPEPGSTSRDLLVEQADAAHERAVRKLQDDVRLADRFEELEQGSRDMLFYRINRRPTAKGIRPTQPGIGNVVALRPEDDRAAPPPAEQPSAEPGSQGTPSTVEAPTEAPAASQPANEPPLAAHAPAASDSSGEAVTPRPVEVPGAGSTQRIASPPVPSAYVSPAEPSESRRSSAPIAVVVALLAIGGLIVALFLLRGEDPREATVTSAPTTTSSAPAAATATSAGAPTQTNVTPTAMTTEEPTPTAPPSASAIETTTPKKNPSKPPQGQNPPDDGPRPLGGKKKVRY